MPYEREGVEFFTGVTIVGKVSKYGSRVLENPPRIEMDLLCPSQRRTANARSMFCVRVSVFDPGDRPNSNDYVRVYGLPDIQQGRMMLMAFGINVEILNKWIAKEKKK